MWWKDYRTINRRTIGKYMFTNQQLLTSFGTFCQLVATFGKFCQLLVLNFRQFVATFDNFWQFLATFGNFGQFLANSDNFWQFFPTCGNFWQFLATFANFWLLFFTFWQLPWEPVKTWETLWTQTCTEQCVLVLTWNWHISWKCHAVLHYFLSQANSWCISYHLCMCGISKELFICLVFSPRACVMFNNLPVSYRRRVHNLSSGEHLPKCLFFILPCVNLTQKRECMHWIKLGFKHEYQ